MYAIQQYCPRVFEHTPVEERNENTGWLTLITCENHDEATHIMNRPYGDGLKRNERIVETAAGR